MRVVSFIEIFVLVLSVFAVSATGKEGGGASIVDLTGYWLGDLEGALRLLLRIPSHPHTRKHPVAMYSLDQFGVMVPANEVEFDETKQQFTFYFDSINGRYKAKLDGDNQVMTGMWRQESVEIPLELRPFTHQTTPTRSPASFVSFLKRL
eukprot:scaffold1717_cov169-Amphora_coffeaeformis.AAC.8